MDAQVSAAIDDERLLGLLYTAEPIGRIWIRQRRRIRLRPELVAALRQCSGSRCRRLNAEEGTSNTEKRMERGEGRPAPENLEYLYPVLLFRHFENLHLRQVPAASSWFFGSQSLVSDKQLHQQRR